MHTDEVPCQEAEEQAQKPYLSRALSSLFVMFGQLCHLVQLLVCIACLGAAFGWFVLGQPLNAIFFILVGIFFKP